MELKRSLPTLKPNYILIPTTRTDDIDAWNEVYLDYSRRSYHEISRTSSGGISIAKHVLRLPCMDVSNKAWGVELLVGDGDGWFRFQFRSKVFDDPKLDEVKTKITGKQALYAFWDALKGIGIDHQAYKLSSRAEGLKIKATIEKPLIQLARQSFANVGWPSHVNHLDINSSYPAGLKKMHPEFAPVLDKWYELKRAGHKEYKAYLNLMIGTMQSPHAGYYYADMAKFAIEENNRKVREMADYLTKHGAVIILYNTDGIWYYDDKNIVPDSMLSDEMGGWKIDHRNCQFRAKSNGAYEFIENGVYTPVIRGRTRLDEVLPRSKWKWGDIYTKNASEIKKYAFTKENGLEVIYEEEELE